MEEDYLKKNQTLNYTMDYDKIEKLDQIFINDLKNYKIKNI